MREWTHAELVAHTGGVRRWVAAMVGDLTERRHSRRETDAGPPADATGHPAWIAGGI